MKKILFLDFDGVLHPDDVYLIQNRIVLKTKGHTLFEHAEWLAEFLVPRDDLDVVLSTSWVRAKGFDYAKRKLPKALQQKVIGSTYHSEISEFWNHATRYQQIARYVRRHSVEAWLAIDDDDLLWPQDMRHRLVRCDGYGAVRAAREDLVLKLEML